MAKKTKKVVHSRKIKCVNRTKEKGEPLGFGVWQQCDGCRYLYTRMASHWTDDIARCDHSRSVKFGDVIGREGGGRHR